MSVVLRRWQEDASGLYIEMPITEKADFGVDWTDYLAAGETISTASWTVPAGVTQSGAAIAGAVTSTFLEAVTAGSYLCSLSMTTSGGRRRPVSFRVVVLA